MAKRVVWCGVGGGLLESLHTGLLQHCYAAFIKVTLPNENVKIYVSAVVFAGVGEHTYLFFVVVFWQILRLFA